MTQEKPTVSLTGLYLVNDAANLLGIHRNTLGQYRRKKLITPETSALTGRHVYRGREILRFWKEAQRTNII